MRGGSPFEQHTEDEDWMHVHASSVTSPSEPTTSSNQASDLQVMRDFHWLEYVQKPTDNKDSSCPAEEVNRLASVLGLANKTLPLANFQHDDIRNNLAARQAEQRNPLFASKFGFSSQHQYYDSTPSFYRSNLLGAQPVAFHLMDVVSDKQDLSFVEKVQVLEAEILKLCNTLAPASAKGKDGVIASINFDALNSQSASVIGFYGDKQFLTRIVQEKNLAPPSLVHDMHSNCLRSGLYGCLNGDGRLYLFYWDARQEVVEANRKDVSCNFVRYLIDLCGTVYVCVDGKTMEEASTTTVKILSIQEKRTQRLQVSMRKESENDLKLLKGFYIDLNANMCYDPVMVRLPQGLHRCLVLSASLNVPKVVSRKDSKTETPANLRAWIEAQANDFHLDCCQLNDMDFLLLLKVLDKQEELQKYSQAEKAWKKKQLEVDEKLQHLDLAMKDKKMELLAAFRSAMECILLQKHPWEESLLATADSGQTQAQQVQGSRKSSGSSEPLLQKHPWEESLLATAYSGQTQAQLVQGSRKSIASSEPNPDCSHLKHEALLCGLWSDRNDSTQRFLYPGSQVEIASMETDGEHSAAPGMVFIIGKKCTQTGKLIDSHKMVDGPICFGQQFMLTSNLTDFHTDFKQECIAFFSQAERTVLSDYEPVILDGETKLILNVTDKKGGDLVMVRHAGGGDMGLITWLTAFYNGPMSLYQNATALSHLISKMDGQQLDDKLLEKLLKEPLKKWLEMNCLTPEQSSVLIEFLAEKQDESISIQEHVSLICASTYKDARLKSFMAVEAFVNSEICPAVRQHLHKQLQQQKEAMRAANGIEAKALLSNMKAQLFILDENSSKRTEQKCKLSLLQLQLRSKSILQSIQYVFTRTDKLTISYTYQELEAETLTWHAVEMVPQKDDVDDLMSNPSSGRVVVPVCGKPTELITLKPKLESLSAVVMVKSGHVLVFVEPVDKSSLHLYYYPQLGGSHMGSNPSRTFKRGCDLWAFDEISRFLALYDRKYGSIKTYRLDEAHHHMEWTGTDIQLSKYSGSSNIVWMEQVPGKREILLGDDETDCVSVN
ncbi:hypothetical protein L7F22_045617 [Adiantum nelumboides]|nr:hypothetical protein [Adiantum nelumboides]